MGTNYTKQYFFWGVDQKWSTFWGGGQKYGHEWHFQVPFFYRATAFLRNGPFKAKRAKYWRGSSFFLASGKYEGGWAKVWGGWQNLRTRNPPQSNFFEGEDQKWSTFWGGGAKIWAWMTFLRAFLQRCHFLRRSSLLLTLPENQATSSKIRQTTTTFFTFSRNHDNMRVGGKN